jgi:hypothetical protein
MGEALWADLDQWQVDYLSARLGLPGLYSTLVAQKIAATVVRNYTEWDNSDVWQFPAIIVSCARSLRPADGVQFGDGSPHYRKTYPYTWMAVVEGDSFTSETDAKILEKRLETAARALVAEGWGNLVADNSGERLIALNVGDSNFARFPRASIGDSDPWWGIVALDIDLITTV